VFPLVLSTTAHQLRKAKQFRIDRQGLDIDVVGIIEKLLKKAPITEGTPAPPVK